MKLNTLKKKILFYIVIVGMNRTNKILKTNKTLRMK